MKPCVLVRYGEISLKSPTVRERMEKLLEASLAFMLKKSGLSNWRIFREPGRIIVYVDDNGAACRAATRCFGVVSASPAWEVSCELEDLRRAAVEIARKAWDPSLHVTFAVRARRLKSYPLTSKELERIIGDDVRRALNAKVNLENPDLTVYIEVRKDKAFVFTDVLEGPGGLPYGSESKLVALFSGGMDSATAAWLCMKRGAEVYLLHASLGSLYSREAWMRVLAVARKLREWVPRDRFELLVFNHENALKTVVEKLPRKLTCLACKHLMLRVAEHVAGELGAVGIVTGDSIGQVASQTLDNLYAITRGIEMPVYRPLAGMDKMEIAALARRIGVYEEAAKSVVTCRVTPEYPETHAKPYALEPYWDLLERLAEDTASTVRSVEV